MKDLTLKHLGDFYGSEKYHKISLYPKVNLTDGIIYIMENGYSWFVTDFLAVAHHEPKVKAEPFLSVYLKLNDSEAVLEVTDGNNNTLYKQEYVTTDAKKELILFYTNNVLMLNSEY